MKIKMEFDTQIETDEAQYETVMLAPKYELAICELADLIRESIIGEEAKGASEELVAERQAVREQFNELMKENGLPIYCCDQPHEDEETEE